MKLIQKYCYYLAFVAQRKKITKILLDRIFKRVLTGANMKLQIAISYSEIKTLDFI
jgi:hypothetical protein